MVIFASQGFVYLKIYIFFTNIIRSIDYGYQSIAFIYDTVLIYPKCSISY